MTGVQRENGTLRLGAMTTHYAVVQAGLGLYSEAASLIADPQVRYRGTIEGLTRHVGLLTGGEVTVVDNGAVAASQTPGGDFPGEPAPRVAVRVEVDDPDAINEAALDRIVVQAKPAHVVHRVEVVGR